MWQSDSYCENPSLLNSKYPRMTSVLIFRRSQIKTHSIDVKRLLHIMTSSIKVKEMCWRWQEVISFCCSNTNTPDKVCPTKHDKNTNMSHFASESSAQQKIWERRQTAEHSSTTSGSSDQRQDVLVPVLVPALPSAGAQVPPEPSQSALWTGELWQERLERNAHTEATTWVSADKSAWKTRERPHLQLLCELRRVSEDQPVLLVLHQLIQTEGRRHASVKRTNHKPLVGSSLAYRGAERVLRNRLTSWSGRRRRGGSSRTCPPPSWADPDRWTTCGDRRRDRPTLTTHTHTHKQRFTKRIKLNLMFH